jgi:hypothetical protein
MRVSHHSAHDPLLKRLSVLVTAANRILDHNRDYERSLASAQSSGRRGL